MSVAFNHTIIRCRDKGKSAQFLTDILGLPSSVPYGPFLAVELSNGVSLDFRDTEGEISCQHYAFLVSEEEFDRIFDRVREHGLAYWADPRRSRAGEINRNDGGRGFYFDDPDGHFLEVLTRPYGSGN